MSSNNNIYIQEYSGKSFVVRGDTQKYKETLKNLGGKWGSNFTDKNTGEKFGAWLFWSSKKEEIENWIKSGLKFKECTLKQKEEAIYLNDKICPGCETETEVDCDVEHKNANGDYFEECCNIDIKNHCFECGEEINITRQLCGKFICYNS